ncbi:MAG: 3-deoxy-manno-octulosonate cytidylyltransferase [Pseudomonadota bacterium]|nr:3-deoxy-manno-octulosonate cytidylyltransferase [Pseudomonadota bacterium]
MNPIVVIPARMASTRLPGKPLAEIAGLPMIVRVLRQAEAAGIGPVVVAAAEREIAEAVEAAGGRAMLTDPALPSGTDRVHAVVEALDKERAHDVVVNLQGDLPALDPADIRAVADVLAPTGADIATLAAEIDDPADFDNPSVVKPVVVWDVTGRRGRALYFSRARIPHGEGPLFHHVGIYAYRRDALSRFVALEPSPLERREKLEQLRALEAGMTIAVARVDSVPLSVDTPADLEKARAVIGRQEAQGTEGAISS